MPKDLLQGVNEVLKRVQVIEGQTGLLASLSDSPRQVFIDTAVQAWNEVVEQVYSISDRPMPLQMDESTLTLVTGDRDYTLASDLLQLYFPLQDQTNGQYIVEYRGGYKTLVDDQPLPASYTGLPTSAVIRPSDGLLYMDRIPTANENGLIYTYQYAKNVSLSAAADTFPFNDAVFRALVPAVSELWKIEHKKEFNQGLFDGSIGRACRYLSNLPPRSQWTPHRSRRNIADPLDA